MNFEVSGLVSLLSGTNGLEGLQKDLTAEGGLIDDFTAALMEQIEMLQQPEALSSTLQNFNGFERAGSLQELAGLLNYQDGEQNFAAILGKGLPSVKQSDIEIDLEQTMDSLREILQQIGVMTATGSAKKGEDTLQKQLSQLEAEVDEITSKSANDIAMLGLDVAVDSADEAMLPALKNTLGSEVKRGLLETDNNQKNSLAALNKLAAQNNEPNAAGAEEERDFLQENKEQQIVKADVKKPDLDIKQDQDVENFERKLAGIESSISRTVADTGQVLRQVRAEVPGMTRTLDQPQWKQELGERIIWMHSKSMPAAEIRLNPQHLGPISVRIDMQNDQANIAFTAQHAAVREALDAALPKLKEMLNAQQLNLGDVNIAQQSFSDQRSSQEFARNSQEQNTEHDIVGRTEKSTEGLTEEIELSRAIISKGLLSIRV
jgi:flagellar hook-length control protein FliK